MKKKDFIETKITGRKDKVITALCSDDEFATYIQKKDTAYSMGFKANSKDWFHAFDDHFTAVGELVEEIGE